MTVPSQTSIWINYQAVFGLNFFFFENQTYVLVLVSVCLTEHKIYKAFKVDYSPGEHSERTNKMRNINKTIIRSVQFHKATRHCRMICTSQEVAKIANYYQPKLPTRSQQDDQNFKSLTEYSHKCQIFYHRE